MTIQAAASRMFELCEHFEEVTGQPGDLYVDDLEHWLALGSPKEPPPHEYIARGDCGVCRRCDNCYPLDDPGLARRICPGDPSMNTGRKHS